jgi:lipoprotein-releasing system permease protein
LNFPFYIARRYVFAKKSHNAINIIAKISVGGISVGTIAFIIVLSVFNGFDSVVRGLFNSFYADLEIVPKIGKTFVFDPDTLQNIKSIQGVDKIAEIVEENALILYDDRQTAATVRGVGENYDEVTGIDTMIWEGEYKLWEQSTPFAVIGRGIKYLLNIELDFFENLHIIVPRRTESITFDPNRALNIKFIRPSGFFASQPEIEIKYILVPIDFARTLFGYTKEVSALEIKIKPGEKVNKVQKKIQQALGNRLQVKNRTQQNELLYKTMRSEKWAIFFILVFVLLVASFNVVGTLTMLIIEKRKDIQVLRYLGSDMKNVKKVFLLEGLIISFLGALTGLIIGSAICIVQQKFGIIKLQGAESFVIDAYPVKIMIKDILLVLITITAIGFFASWYPIRFITRKYLSTEDQTNLLTLN